MAKQIIKKFNIPFVIDLQRFSDTAPIEGHPQAQQQSEPSTRDQVMAILQKGTQQPAAGVAQTQGQPQTTDGNHQVNSQQNIQQPNQDATQGQPQQAPSSADQMLLGKFKSPEELANGYTNVEKAYTQKSQELATVQQENQALQTALEQLKQQIGNVVNPQQQQQQELSQEQQAEQFMTSFYNNPIEAIKTVLMPQLQPIQQQYQAQQKQAQWDNAVAQFTQQTPDFNSFKDNMVQILQQNPELNNHPDPMKALSIAYNAAKGQQYQDPNMLLQNQDFVKQKILSNQDIKNQIIQEYLQGLQQGNQAPTVIAGQPGGQTTIIPPTEPKTIKDAHNIALSYFKK